MSDMAEVIRLHSKFGRDEKGQNCRYCGYHYGNNAGRELHEQAAFHIAAALSAAGFGLVAEFSSRQMQLAALMAYDAVEDGALREAGAKALEDAADEWSDWDALQAPEDWLRARATAVRGEG